jgi:hypothetical protein
MLSGNYFITSQKLYFTLKFFGAIFYSIYLCVCILICLKHRLILKYAKLMKFFSIAFVSLCKDLMQYNGIEMWGSGGT